MSTRTNYEMTQESLEKILDACRPTPVMYLSGGVPLGGSPQENANRAWAELGERMGFDWNTVRPIEGKSSRFFTAVPLETAEQHAERVAREREASRVARLTEVKAQIAVLEAELAALNAEE